VLYKKIVFRSIALASKKLLAILDCIKKMQKIQFNESQKYYCVLLLKMRVVGQKKNAQPPCLFCAKLLIDNKDINRV